MFTDAEIDYWGDVFVNYEFGRLMTFAQFMLRPLKYYQEITGDERPPGISAEQVSEYRLHRACSGLAAAIDKLDLVIQRINGRSHQLR